MFCLLKQSNFFSFVEFRWAFQAINVLGSTELRFRDGSGLESVPTVCQLIAILQSDGQHVRTLVLSACCQNLEFSS